MEDFESAAAKAVEAGVVAGGAVVGVGKDGTIKYQKAFGKTGVDDAARPMELDSVVWIASCTKLLTGISAMQCVEKGLLELDAPIATILPEWKDPDILTGFDSDGKPTMHKASTPITLRMLLSHSSGMSYAFMDPVLAEYCVATGRDPATAREGVEKDYFLPLVYEPGAGWAYSCGIDWAGRMVERVNNKISLGKYMTAHIFDVLGMTSTTFHPRTNKDISARMCGRPLRGADGKLSAEGAPDMLGDPTDDYGGGGLYSCASDYIKVLTSLLLDDGKLLKSESVKELFSPALPDGKYIKEAMNGPFRGGLAPGWPMDGVEFNYSVGGCIVLNEVPNQGEKNVLFWSGLPNSQWYIDRGRGVAGFYATQVFPPGDLPTHDLYAKFRKGMYTMA